MSNPKTVLNGIYAVLAGDATLSGYVKKFLKGRREGVAAKDYPCVMIEPSFETEAPHMSDVVIPTATFIISAYTMEYNLDTQVVGSTAVKGILDLDVDIKAALGAEFPTLGSVCDNFAFPRTEFEIDRSNSNYPVRGVHIELAVMYRAAFSDRT